MKSVYIAGTAIGVTIATLGGVATFAPSAERVIGTSYDRAFNTPSTDGVSAARAMAHQDGSEHYWLTRATTGSDLNVMPAVASAPSDTPPVADIKSAIVAGNAIAADQIEIVSVQPIARAAIGVEVGAAKSFLVTARIEGSAHERTRIVTIVLDVAPGMAGHRARSL